MQTSLFLKTFCQVRWLEKWTSREQIHAHQDKLWQKQKAYFLEHSPYFKEHGFREDFIMDKAMMMSCFDELNTVGIKKVKALEIALASEKNRDFSQTYGAISVGLSSGTSGHQGLFVTSQEEQTIWAATILAKLLPKGHVFGHRIAFFMRANNNLYEKVDSKAIHLQFFDMQEPLEHHLKLLQDFQPTLLVGPPSVLLGLSHHVEKKELSIDPKKIISIAEILEEQDKAYIASVFAKEIIDQVYQATEGFLGHTCEFGIMHLNEESMIIEKEWLDEKRFYPIITDLKRKSQPFVRYRLNDILQLCQESCPCGSARLAIAKVEGRSDDLFYGKTTKGENILIYPDFIRRCFYGLDGYLSYRVRQIDFSRLVIEMDPMTEENQERIQMAFGHLADNMNCLPFYLGFATYQKESDGKLRRIIQEMPINK